VTSPTFDDVVAPLDGRVVFPTGWLQGRGLFGGLVTAAMARTLEQSAAERPLRSLTAEICGPVQPGEATLERTVLREGNAVTTTTIRLVQGSEVLAHGVGVLGKTRTAERDQVTLPRPVMPPWRDVEVVDLAPPMAPDFTPQFEFRPIGPLPFSGGSLAEHQGWIRPRAPGRERDAGYLAACVDAYYPALFMLEELPRPMATIAFTFQPFAHFEGLDPDAPLFHRAKLIAVSGGYCVEFRELWGEDGRLLALNQQTFVIIK
jgi:acyl-CoA thioesterase